MFERLTHFLDGFLEMGIPGYDCVVYQKGKCVYRRRNGYSDIEEKIPVRGNERYQIYSCTKPITCTAALQLYEKGCFQLEDELKKYMPEFAQMYVRTPEGIKKAENSIKIKDLFCMTAGFSYNLNSEQLKRAQKETEGKCPTRKTMEYLAREPLLFEPGERYEYSLCHDVLAALVEVLSGELFRDYVRKHIFEPLEMEHSAIHLEKGDWDTLTEQYRYDGEIINCGNRNEFRLGTEYDSGGAGAVSTVEDYIRFLEALRKGGILLKSETTDLMSTNCLSESQRRTYTVEGYGYGLGVRCPIDEKKTDFGWGGAAGAFLAVDRKNEITLFYAQQVRNTPNTQQRYQLMEMVKVAVKV